MADKSLLFKKCTDFHGHSCGGLMIGFRAALYTIEQFNLENASEDEELVCIAENDACGIDAIQALLGCTAGKGNLILRLRGKQAFSFYDRKSGRAMRIVLKEKSFASKEEKHRYMLEAPSSEIFEFTEPKFALPKKAEIYSSEPCAGCGERTAEPWLRVKDGKHYCLDCCEGKRD